MTSALLGKIRRGLRKPPHVIAARIKQELLNFTERYYAPRRAKQFTLQQLLKKTQQNTLSSLWSFLSARPYVTNIHPTTREKFEQACPGEAKIIDIRAQWAMEHRVDLLGSGLIALGTDIDWHKDYKSGFDWPKNYMRSIDYNNPDRPSDVKFPWEVSRLQWLIPVGQAYLLSQDEKYAEAVKHILSSWIEQNPYSIGVNWACTMEVALRILSWTWFFHVFKASHAWQDEVFQQKFLNCLYLHADFTARHLEFSDVNGNHYTADAAGLVFAGLFWGTGADATRWQTMGWEILNQELPKQVFEDGVDFEASVPYHRLVFELFFLPACYYQTSGFNIPQPYKERLIRMAEFTEAYIQPNESVPLWGDADDARALPFGIQATNDHRYLMSLVGYFFQEKALIAASAGPQGELFWTFGAEATAAIAPSLSAEAATSSKTSKAFPYGGFYIMCHEEDHIFIDCGPLGLAGRGGHGHNDCLSFEAVLNGVKLITDCGAYVYTASYRDRNLFRSTAYHNTPMIDQEEINRFIGPDFLWNLHEDAKPEVITWNPGIDRDEFCGSHTGYQRLADPVSLKRTIQLTRNIHRLDIQDEITCKTTHDASIPLHLAPNVSVVSSNSDKQLILEAEGKQFSVNWAESENWTLSIEDARVSPSYGVVMATQKLVWTKQICGKDKLNVFIQQIEAN